MVPFPVPWRVSTLDWSLDDGWPQFETLLGPITKKQQIPVEESHYMQSYELPRSKWPRANTQPGPDSGETGLMHLMQRLNLQDPLASKWRFKGALMPLTSPTSLVCKPTSHNWPGPKGLMQIGRWLKSPARRPWIVINKYYKCFILKSSSQIMLILMGLKLIWGPSWSWQLALRLMDPPVPPPPLHVVRLGQNPSTGRCPRATGSSIERSPCQMNVSSWSSEIHLPPSSMSNPILQVMWIILKAFPCPWHELLLE